MITIEDYTTIKTYEDACEALGLMPYLSEDKPKALCVRHDCYDFRQNMPRHIIALMKLETVSRALWGRDFEPKPDAEDDKTYYYPYFVLYTKNEIKTMSKINPSALFYNGFGFIGIRYYSPVSDSTFSFRLCQETEKKAGYFGRQFLDLWAEYLAFNFTAGKQLGKHKR